MDTPIHDSSVEAQTMQGRCVQSGNAVTLCDRQGRCVHYKHSTAEVRGVG